MNTFKTAVVLATLVGVGYGVHIVLNKPIPGPGELGASTWGEIPDVDYNIDPPDVSIQGFEPPPPANEENTAAAHSDSFLADTSPSGAIEQTSATSPAGPNWDGSAGPSGQPQPEANAATEPDTTSHRMESFGYPSDAYSNDGAFAAEAPPGTPTTAQGTMAPVPDGREFVAENGPAAPSEVETASHAVPSGSGADATQQLAAGGFEEVWRAAQKKLAANQIADALFTLTIWYNDPSLSIEDRDRLIPLLDQLAGTVIYSREHHLAPQYTAAGGEVLEQVARQYNVPAEFLSRVNGIPLATSLSPGQSLKVVPGPFRAELDLEKRQLTLFLNHYYAGRFSIGVGRDLPSSVEQMEVVEKMGPRPYRDSQTNHEIPAGAAENPYGNHWIGLRDMAQPTNTLLGIHSWGAEVDAADTRGCISVDEQGADDLQAILSVGAIVRVVRR